VSFIPIPTDLESRECYVYAIFCQDGGGPGYVKFGHSTRLGDRLSVLSVSCPIPAKMFAFIHFSRREKAIAVEKSLLKHFASRKVSGEWFRFEFTSRSDKDDFNAGCRKVFVVDHNVSDWWVKVSAEAIKEDARRRRQEFLAKKTKRQLNALNNRRRKEVYGRIYAAREISSKW
jgi:hypothetical protein